MGQLVFIPFAGGSSPSPVPSDTLDIYLSGANGDDAFDGLTPATAKATPAGVWALFPSGLSGPLVVHVGAAGVVGDGTAYNWASMPIPVKLNETARIWLYGDGAGQPGEDGFEEIFSGETDVGTDSEQITVAVPIVANEYQHYTLSITSGAANTFYRTIQSNTTTSIVPCRRFENVDGVPIDPGDGTSYRVLRPSAIFDNIQDLGGQPGFLANTGGGDGAAPLFLVNVAFDNLGPGEINDSAIYIAGVEFRGTVFPSFVSCTGSIGYWDNFRDTLLGRTSLLLPANQPITDQKGDWTLDIGLDGKPAKMAQWRGWGASCPDITTVDTTNLFRFYGCSMSVMGTFSRVGIYGCPNMGLGGYFWGGLDISSNSYCAAIASNFTTGANATGFISRAVLSVSESSSFVCYAPLTATVAEPYCVKAQQNAYVFLGDVSHLTGSTTFAIDIRDHSVLSAWNGLVISGQGGLRAYNESVFFDMYSVTGTALAGSGIQLINSRYSSQYAGAISFSLVGASNTNGILLTRASHMSLTDTVSITSAVANLVGCLMHRQSVLQTSGSFTISTAGTALSLADDSSFLQVGGSTSITSTATTALSVVDSRFILRNTALTLVGVGSTGGMSASNSELLLRSTTNTTLTGPFFLSNSNLQISATAALTGLELTNAATLYSSLSLTVNGTFFMSQGSRFLSDGAFTSTGASTFSDSVCIHRFASPSYNTGSTMSLVRSEIHASQGITLRQLSAYGSRVIASASAPAGTTTFSGATALVQSEVFAANAIVFDSTVTCTQSVVAGTSTCAAAGLVTLTGSLMSASSTLTFTAGVNASGSEIVAGANFVGSFVTLDASRLRTSAVVTLTAGMYVRRSSEWTAVGAMGASSIGVVGDETINIETASVVNLAGVTSGTLTLNGVAGRSCVDVIDSEFHFNNANILTTGADVGISFGTGGRVFIVSGSATNIVGTVNDFSDTQGGFSNALITANRCVFTGQHPAGVYDNTQPIIGSGFVQRS